MVMRGISTLHLGKCGHQETSKNFSLWQKEKLFHVLKQIILCAETPEKSVQGKNM